MSDESNDNKTEAPTPRRREQAREEGQVINSPDLTSGLVLLSLGIVTWLFGGTWILAMGESLAEPIRRPFHADMTIGHAVISVRWLAVRAGIICGVVVAGTWLVNSLSSSFQAGFAIHTKPLELDVEKMSPIKGWSRIWSLDGMMRGLLGVLKVSGILTVSAIFIWWGRDRLLLEARGDLMSSLVYIGGRASLFMTVLACIALLFGALDYMFKRYRHEEKLKMSKDEIKREMRESEGSPEAKQKIKKFAQEALKRKSLKDVPDATAVVTNPTHYAVAIRYVKGQAGAPTVVAKGSDQFARQIIAKAKEHGVPVLERKPVARALYALGEVGKEIPMALYQVVAEVLADVYRRRAA